MAQWMKVDTGSGPAPYMAAIATVVAIPQGEVLPTDFTFTADGSLDSLFSDTVDLPEYKRYRGILCTVAGNLKIRDHLGNVIGPFAVPAGVVLPIRPRRIYSTLTTCTGVYPLWGDE